VDKRYELYCLVDQHFYDSTSRLPAHPRDFELSHAPAPKGWMASERDNWHVLHPIGADFPEQGWKVHVSACLDNVECVLTAVADYCINRRIVFKFLRSVDALMLANAKYANRGSSGKFATIYPADEAQLKEVLTELGEVLDGSPGPYVLSDLRWHNGPLYVRYGGFVERHRLSETGSVEPAIVDPQGRLVPDRRTPTFRYPDWVRLPPFLDPHLAARNDVKVDSLPYRIERALHFSNGGGLYVGQHIATGAQVVLKEARPHAGLDSDGTDAVARLRREQEMLQRLSGLDTVPAVHDAFTLGEHHFLALEFIDATPLRKAIVNRYPLVKLGADEQTIAEYTSWALDVQAKVERAIDAFHKRGVVIGDLHPFNVLVRPDGRVALVDFEVAAGIEEGRRQTLANPGFAAPRGYTGFDIDRYALACLRLFLFLPLTTLLAIDRAKAVDFAAVISESFPVPAAFLDEAVQVIGGQPSPVAPQPSARSQPSSFYSSHRLDPEHESWEQIRASLAGAILASATPDRDDRLFPGDIEQFQTGGLNIAHGAAGVLYALELTGAGRHPEHEEWLLQRAMNPASRTTRPGFYNGLHGVAYVLDHLGYRAEALKVLDMCTTELDGQWNRLSLDLHGGLAGIGLNLAHFAAITADPSIRTAAFTVAQAVAERLGSVDSVDEVSSGSHPYAGLMRGSAGPALLFIRLYEQVGEPALLDLARTALRQDLRRCVVRDDGSMEVNEGWRTMPYLADGSAGIGIVLNQYLAHRDNDDEFIEAIGRISRVARSAFYIAPGLFAGRAGMILYLRHGGGPRDRIVDDHIRRLAWHAVDYQGCPAFPGQELLRLSMDLATGTAGVLLAVGAALHSAPVHLPFLDPALCAQARTEPAASPIP
jgi:serine/threonine protein kinase